MRLDLEMMDYSEAGRWVFGVYLAYMLFMSGIGIAAYILKAFGMYSIAKRRGIQKPWLAWIPVAEIWTLGCISDQYQYVVKGKVRNKRKSLLILSILTYAACAAFFIAYIVFAVQLFMTIGAETQGMAINDTAFISAVLWMMVFFLIMLGISIACAVIQYMALYDLYRSCDPNNSALYLVLSIFFSIVLPVFVFICRKKDLGMPPRRENIPPQSPPQEPCEN